jgi:hypothetical protein
MVVSISIAREKNVKLLKLPLFFMGYDINVMQGCLKKVTKH